MNKAMTKIFSALACKQPLKVNGHNMETRMNGTRYEVAIDGNVTRLFYWGHEVATFNADGSLDIDSCGYHSATTKKVINVALDCFGNRNFARIDLYQSNYDWFLHFGEYDNKLPSMKWNGEKVNINRDMEFSVNA